MAEYVTKEKVLAQLERCARDPLHPNGGITINCKDDRDCVFCERCTDVWWDYTNLIYMIACADDHDPWERPCKYFKEGEEQ